MNMNIDFIKADTRKAFFSMALPMMAAMFLNLAYNIVDSIWIGNLLGENAMAALTSAMPVILLLTSIAMGASNGLSILLSQRIGAKKNTASLITTSLIASLTFSVVLTVLLERNLPLILQWLRTPAEIIDRANDYLSVYLLGYTAVFLYLYFTAVLRSYGNTMLQAAAILLCTILNAVLDPIMIKLIGFHGAAVATLISQTIAAVILVLYLVRKKLFYVKLKTFSARLLLKLGRVALPSMIQQSIPAISTSFLTAVISGFGITAIAAYGIAGKLETLLLYPAMAFNMVLTTIIGQCIGGKRADRAKDYVKCAFCYGGSLVLALSLLVAAFAKPLSGLFVQTDAIASMVSVYFLVIGIGYLFNTLTNCLLGAINGIGKPLIGMLLMLFYYLIVRMPLAFLFSKTAAGANGIWFAVLISHLVAFVSAAVIYKRINKM